MNMRIGVLSFAVLAAASAVSAKEKYKEVINAGSQDKFEQISTSVRDQMRTGGRYEFVTPTERGTIDKSLADMDALFKQRGAVAQMTQDEKVKLFNAQEVVNSILTKRDSDRVICENQAPVGSHIPVTNCHTYGQAEEARRGTNKKLQDWNNTGCVGGTPGHPCMAGKNSGGGG